MRGSISKRGDAWRIRVYVGRDRHTGAKRWACRTVRGTRREAEQACAALVTEIGAGFHSEADRTVADLLARWMALIGPDLSPSTLRDYRSAIDRHITPALGSTKLAKVRASDLDDWYRALPLGPARVRRVHNILSAAFDQAVRWQWVAHNPCASARPPKVRETEINPPTETEVRALIAAADTPDFAAYLRLAAETGARRGELIALRWPDIDLDAHAVTIRRAVVDAGGELVVKRTKTNVARVVSISAATAAELRGVRSRQLERGLSTGVHAPDDAPVFTCDAEGEVGWHPSTVSHWFASTVRRAGQSGVRLHDLRHFAATQMLAAGVDVRTAAARLGHRNVAVLLNRYAHALPAADRDAAEGLGRLLSGD
jgi:integrase